MKDGKDMDCGQKDMTQSDRFDGEEILIFGAKSLALGACVAIEELYPRCRILGFVVSAKEGNPPTLHGLPVMELGSVERKETLVCIAAPEDAHADIVETLKRNGFHRYLCMDSRKESRLMNSYYAKLGRFPALHGENELLRVCMAKSRKDRPLKNPYDMPDWITPVQAGAALADARTEWLCDDAGENISAKNRNYCELTVLYWMWKNLLSRENGADYYGLFHYRRVLQLGETDLDRLKQNDIDVILPYPMLHEPDISEHHTRYVQDGDWNAMRRALEELQPEYAAAFPKIFAQPYFYNYNILIAKKEVLRDYCAWLFQILSRTEEFSVPKGSERADRYIGYLGENLLTLYFLYHQDDLNIVHTGRIMLT